MSRSRTLFAILAAACLAASCAFVSAVDRAVSAVNYATCRLLAVVAEPFKQKAFAPTQEKPRTLLAAAKIYCTRLMKRRPTVQPSSWRMCSST